MSAGTVPFDDDLIAPDPDVIAAVEAELRESELSYELDLPVRVESDHGISLFELQTGRLVVVKRSDDHRDGERLVRNEVAAWEIAKLLGWIDLVPPTVAGRLASEHGEVVVSVQAFCQNGMPCGPIRTIPLLERQRACAFDVIISQTDRHDRNWLVVTDGRSQPHLKLIDHGRCFGYPPGRPPSSSFVTYPLDLPTAVREDVYRLLAAAESGALSSVLAESEIRLVVRGAQNVVG